MKIEDRLAINDLYVRYCVAIDTGDLDSWLSVFAEDAELIARQSFRGHDELAAFLRLRYAAQSTDATANSQHWTSNLVLSGEPPEVRGFCYVLRIATPHDGGAPAIVINAAYKDLLRCVDGSWRFARRTVLYEMPASADIWSP